MHEETQAALAELRKLVQDVVGDLGTFKQTVQTDAVWLDGKNPSLPSDPINPVPPSPPAPSGVCTVLSLSPPPIPVRNSRRVPTLV
jgi:hypothetical protein